MTGVQQELVSYANALSGPDAMSGWIAEGPVRIDQGPTGVVLSSTVGDGESDDGHWTLWCPETFGSRIAIEWEFRPISEPGLAMIFFAATGHSGSLFGADQLPRDGRYPQYHSGDLDALHISYFRHKWAEERAFRTCNLRKSAGFHLVAQGADPLPPADDATDFYRMRIVKDGDVVSFLINDLLLFRWHDDGSVGGPALGAGQIGIRQMTPLVAEYRNFRVTPLDTAPATPTHGGTHV